MTLQIDATFRDGDKEIPVNVLEVYREGRKRYAKVQTADGSKPFHYYKTKKFSGLDIPDKMIYTDEQTVNFDHLKFPYHITTWWDVCMMLQEKDWSEQMREEVPA